MSGSGGYIRLKLDRLVERGDILRWLHWQRDGGENRYGVWASFSGGYREFTSDEARAFVDGAGCVAREGARRARAREAAVA